MNGNYQIDGKNNNNIVNREIVNQTNASIKDQDQQNAIYYDEQRNYQDLSKIQNDINQQNFDLQNVKSNEYNSFMPQTAGTILNNQNYLEMSSQMSDERISGYPQPQLYDQHYINKYAYPKGLKCAGRRTDKEEKIKRSLYDMGIP